MIEKYGVEESPQKISGEKTSSESCSHPGKDVRTEGSGAQQVFFCSKCQMYLPAHKSDYYSKDASWR